jgi:hypothetical protein
VRSYALTYPQLVAQARADGADADTLRALRSSYETCQRVFDGFHRGCGEPFECHMVRVASIVMTEGLPLTVTKAALVHSAYDVHRYDDSTRRAPRAAHRRYLQRAVGTEAEALVWAFAQIDDWPRGVKAHLDALPESTELDRWVLSLYVINELANHLDLGKAYRAGWPFRERLVDHGDDILALTRALGFPVIADELDLLFREHLEDEIPAEAAGRRRPYEMPRRRRWQRRPVEQAAFRLRRSVRRNRRRVARRLARR